MNNKDIIIHRHYNISENDYWNSVNKMTSDINDIFKTENFMNDSVIVNNTIYTIFDGITPFIAKYLDEDQPLECYLLLFDVGDVYFKINNNILYFSTLQDYIKQHSLFKKSALYFICKGIFKILKLEKEKTYSDLLPLTYGYIDYHTGLITWSDFYFIINQYVSNETLVKILKLKLYF